MSGRNEECIKMERGAYFIMLLEATAFLMLLAKGIVMLID
jgi:hypothetical protein